MTERIEILIAKFCFDELTEKEAQELVSWVERDENIALFHSYISLNHAIEELKAQDQNDNEIWQKISAATDSPVRRLGYMRYAVAASIVVLLGIVFFISDRYKGLNPVVANVEVPGTIGADRATLTLEDGTNITLGSGSTYAADNVESDGSSIVYSRSDKEAMSYNNLTVPRSGQFLIELSDKTKVWLNSESQLKFPEEFVSGQDRVVELAYGEAYFEVSSSSNHGGSPFKVVTNQQEISVLGTRFNVKAYDDEGIMYTTLIEGKVNVSNGIVDSDLQPGQQATVSDESYDISISNVSAYDEISWKDGVFSFEGESLDEIMNVISRWYDVDIIFESEEMKDVQFVGVFTKYQSLQELLNIIEETKSINAYEVKDETIIIK